MCGIAGIIESKGVTTELEHALQSMQQSLRKRGPDDRGLWFSQNRAAGLAHTRLSILDLSPAGHQPMTSPDGALAITFNGEIYNFRELRAGLEKDGVQFRTQTDTEVLLRLYERDGPSMVDKLRGMFAFAIWDGRTQTAFLARDPLGIKPLYYTFSGGRLAFASELRALTKARLTGKELDPGALMRYFKTGSVAEPQTLLRNVFSLEAAHTLTWKAGTAEIKCYWQITFGTDPIPHKQAVERAREALLDSVRAHFVSDVPVGVFLSGGIDSTALVALSRAIGQKDISTFSIGVDDDSLDESSVARRTSAHFGTDHHEMHLTGELAEKSFSQFLASMDQPSIDGLNTFTVSAFAREQGMKVVLSGLGGDEIFGGYPSFQRVPKLARLGRLAHTSPPLASLVGRLLESSSLLAHRERRFGAFLRQEPSILNAYRTFRGIFSAREAQILASRYTGQPVDEIAAFPLPHIAALDERDAVSECELTQYMRNQLLKDSDVMSMAHGLELRVPFVDRVLFEAVSRIPADLRLRQGKQMLLDAVPEIPEWVASQPKRGFSFPFDKWLEATWGDAFREATARIPTRNPTWYQRWSVFMLSKWEEELHAS